MLEATNTQAIPYLYTGKELDTETGLYYFGARYYDPRTSVWQSGDPILGKYLPSIREAEQVLGIVGGVFESSNLGLYTYSRNNPVVLKDPDGNVAPLIVGAIVAGAAVAGLAVDIATLEPDYSGSGRVESSSGPGDLLGGPAAAAGRATLAAGKAALQSGRALADDAAAAAKAGVEKLNGFFGRNTNLPFKHGDYITKSFNIGDEVIEIGGQASIKGKHITLEGTAIFPVGKKTADIGRQGVIELRDKVAKEFKSLGFEKLTIQGERISGANPGKLPDITIDLTKIKN